jgi:putative ABC transport system permease protein
MQRDAPVLRVFRGLLWLYPPEFRAEFAREICFTFTDRLREEPTFACALSMYWGVLTGAPKEHYHMLRQDIVYTLRTTRREKAATFTAILVLALGIGSTTAIFTLANGLLLRPLPYPHQETLVTVGELPPGATRARNVSFPNFLDLRARTRTLADFALFNAAAITLRGDFEAERVPGATVTGSLFAVTGVQPLLGRWFTAEDDQPNAPPTVMLGEGLWRRRYGADSGVLGKSVIIGTTPTRVIGIMPLWFRFPKNADLWIPLSTDTKSNRRTDYWLEGVARLGPGVSMQQAETDLLAVMDQIKRENPTETMEQSMKLAPFRDRTTATLEPLLFALLAAVGFVLLIACFNITNLLLVKASARAREIAVRAAMGATRMRIIRQCAAESLILGLAGAIGGSLFAAIAVPGMMRLTPPEFLPAWVSFTPDTRILAFIAAITIGASLIAGAAPAISASRLNLVDALKESGRSSTPGSAKARLRGALVVAEVAMSILLLAGAGLMIRTFYNLGRQSLGIHEQNLTTFVAAVPGDRYARGEPSHQVARRIREELAAMPGVVSSAGASGTPILDGWGRSLTVEGWPVLSLRDAPIIRHTVVTPGYFQTMGIAIIEGRDFTEQDAGEPLVAIVDAALARRYWPNQSALGKRIRVGPPADNEPWHIVVGVSGEVRESVRAPGNLSVYLPYREYPSAISSYLVRARAGTPGIESGIRARIASVDRGIAVSRVRTMEDILAASVWQERFFATLLASFGALAMLLAAVGLYGVMAYAVSRRTHEMGIRMAMGASTSDISRMILRQSGRLIAIGLVLGLLGAIAVTRYLKTQLYGVTPTDVPTLAAVAIVLALAGLAASYIPARRATRVDPMAALRAE